MEERKAIVESKYHIPITADIEKEMNEMCNYSQSIERRGCEKTLVEALKALIANLGFTKEQAMAALSIPKDQWEKYAAMI